MNTIYECMARVECLNITVPMIYNMNGGVTCAVGRGGTWVWCVMGMVHWYGMDGWLW